MTEVFSYNNISILRDFNSGKVTWQLQWHKKPYRFISYKDVSESTLKELEKAAIGELLRDTAHDVGLLKEDLDGLQKQELSLTNKVV